MHENQKGSHLSDTVTKPASNPVKPKGTAVQIFSNQKFICITALIHDKNKIISWKWRNREKLLNETS
jgi:hypothetical protein